MELTGLEEFREWMTEKGFVHYKNQFSQNGNYCNWYSCRRVKQETRECETNGHKINIAVTPFQSWFDSKRFESVQVDITGECDGVWYKLQAYSLSMEEFKEKIDDVESALVKAWGALK